MQRYVSIRSENKKRRSKKINLERLFCHNLINFGFLFSKIV